MRFAAIRSLFTGTADLVWPHRCWLCEGHSDAELCEHCSTDLAADPFPSCPRCGSTVGPFAVLDGGCIDCRGSRLRFDAVVRLGPYENRLRETILRLKHGIEEGLAEVVGELFARNRHDLLTTHKPDVIIPVPLHWRRRILRGYNQSAAVARGLAAHLGLRVEPTWLVRVRPTPTQQGLSAAARRENLRDAFQIARNHRVQGVRVLLVDDVMTTGATADAAAAALRGAGAAQVTVAVLARR